MIAAFDVWKSDTEWFGYFFIEPPSSVTYKLAVRWNESDGMETKLK